MSDEYAEDYVSKAPKALRWLDCKRKRILDWFIGLPLERKGYATGVALLAIAAGMCVFNRPEASFFAQAGAVVFAFGLLPLIASRYEWVWRNLFGKVIIAGLLALATNIAYGFGRQIVAGLVGTSPGPFGATVNVATVLFSPVLVLVSVAIGGIFVFLPAVYVGFLALTAMLHFPGKIKVVCIWLCRLVALGIAVFGAWSVLKGSNTYAEWTSRRCAEYLYTFELYHDAQLTTNKVEKAVALPDGRLLVGFPKEGGGYTFVTRSPEVFK